MQEPIFSLAGAWASFEQMIVPDSVSPAQRREMRLAFYAGAQSLLDIIEGNLDPGDEPTETDLRRMHKLTEELVQFGQDIQAGKA